MRDAACTGWICIRRWDNPLSNFRQKFKVRHPTSRTHLRLLMDIVEAKDFPTRLKQLRKRKELSQNDLAELVGVHFTQISRYERAETKPGADAAASLARVLDTTVDFLMSGTTSDIVEAAGLDKELISRLREVQDLPQEEKRTVLSLLDAFVAKSKIQAMLGA